MKMKFENEITQEPKKEEPKKLSFEEKMAQAQKKKREKIKDYDFNKDLKAYIDKVFPSGEMDLVDQINKNYTESLVNKNIEELEGLENHLEAHISYNMEKSHDSEEDELHIVRLEMLLDELRELIVAQIKKVENVKEELKKDYDFEKDLKEYINKEFPSDQEDLKKECSEAIMTCEEESLEKVERHLTNYIKQNKGGNEYSEEKMKYNTKLKMLLEELREIIK